MVNLHPATQVPIKLDTIQVSRAQNYDKINLHVNLIYV